MRVFMAFLGSLAITLSLLSVPGFAEVPNIVSYQGRVTDGGGSPVADGDYELRFRIYDAASAGTLLWDSGPRNVSVSDGLFNYNLGDSTAFPTGMFAEDSALWLGVTVESDPEISPRTRLTASGWALHAETVEISPGITQLLDNSSHFFLNGFLTDLGSDTIEVPAAGFVMAQATLRLTLSHAAGTLAAANIEFRDSTFTHLVDQEHVWVINDLMPSGLYETTRHVHRIFEVAAGKHSFILLGSDFGDPGNTFIGSNIVTTLTYYPKSYGTVDLLGSPVLRASDANRIPLSDSEMSEMRARVSRQDR
jgi:hypothetical protein